MKIKITDTFDAYYEWNQTDADEERSTALFGNPLKNIDSLSFEQLGSLFFPDLTNLTHSEVLLMLTSSDKFRKYFPSKIPHSVYPVRGTLKYSTVNKQE